MALVSSSQKEKALTISRIPPGPSSHKEPKKPNENPKMRTAFYMLHRLQDNTYFVSSKSSSHITSNWTKQIDDADLFSCKSCAQFVAQSNHLAKGEFDIVAVPADVSDIAFKKD